MTFEDQKRILLAERDRLLKEMRRIGNILAGLNLAIETISKPSPHGQAPD